jgi:hypothetical protein
MAHFPKTYVLCRYTTVFPDGGFKPIDVYDNIEQSTDINKIYALFLKGIFDPKFMDDKLCILVVQDPYTPRDIKYMTNRNFNIFGVATCLSSMSEYRHLYKNKKISQLIILNYKNSLSLDEKFLEDSVYLNKLLNNISTMKKKQLFGLFKETTCGMKLFCDKTSLICNILKQEYEAKQ